MVKESWLHQRIVEQVPLATMVWQAKTDDPQDLRLVYAGPRSETIAGRDLTPLVGRRIGEVLPAVVSRGSHHRVFNIATGSLQSHQAVYRYGDDKISESWFRIDVRPLGERCALVSYANITHQQEIFLRPPEYPTQPRAGKALAEIDTLIGSVVGDVEQWLYQRIVEEIPLAVLVWWAETDDPRDLRMVYCGPHSTAITGTDMTRFVGLRLSEAFPGLYETDLPYRFFAVATGGQSDYYEAYPYSDENVPEGWFQIEAQPIGQRCVLVTYTNITKQLQAIEALQQQQREAAVLAEIGRIVSASLDLQDVYKELAASVRELIPHDWLTIATTDLERNTITLVYNTYASASPDPRWAIGRANPLPAMTTAIVVQTRRPLLMQAATDDALLAKFPGARNGLRRGIRSTIAVPLIARDAVVGLLLLRAGQANAFTQYHVNLAQQVAVQIAGAIANAWAYATVKEAEATEAVLAEIGRIISASLDIQDVYAPLATGVRQLIPYDLLSIATVDMDQDTITNVYSTTPPSPEWAIGQPRALRGLAIESVVRARAPLLMQAATEAELLAKFPKAREGLEHGLRSTVMVPLVARDEVVGVLTLRVAQANAYRPRHLDLAAQVGTQIAGAIANAWAYAALKEKEESEAALRRSNTELEQFAYVASHDLQEPLRVVGSYIQLLSRRYTGLLDERADRYISRSTAGIERMRTLINDLLTYSRVGTHDLDMKPINMDVVVAEVLERLVVTIRETGAEITWDPLPVVQADATQVGQLLQNLLGNALKYRGEQPPRVHIGVERQDGRWQISVQDNGIGIDPQYAERIFLVFQRLHTRKEYPGTGIGLALCQKIVERHGGQLTVESQEGAGATFSFTLPAA